MNSSVLQSAGVSLIIPVSRSTDPEDLSRLLRTISSQSYGDFEVLIAPDNEFTAESLGKKLNKERVLGLKMRVLHPPHQLGATAARNFAARHSVGDLLGFLDDDVLLDSRWIEFAVESFDDPLVGGVSGQALVDVDYYHLGYVPKALQWVIGGCYWDAPNKTPVVSAAGMNFCVRRMVFTSIQGYDESLGPSGDRPEAHHWLRLGAEESDLAVRIITALQLKVIYCPKMVVRHRLRRETVLPFGLARRALHVGHNRAYIRFKHGKTTSNGDYEILRNLISTSFFTMEFALRPVFSWKRFSFTVLVIFGVAIGYLTGFLQSKGDSFRRIASENSNDGNFRR